MPYISSKPILLLFSSVTFTQKALVKDIKGIRVAILAYCNDLSGECQIYREGVEEGPAILTEETVQADIDELKELKVNLFLCVGFFLQRIKGGSRDKVHHYEERVIFFIWHFSNLSSLHRNALAA